MKLYFLLLFFSILLTVSAQNNPNDCINAIPICGTSNLGVDPTGAGFDEFSLPGNNLPECYDFGQNTIWFRFDIIGDGPLTFDLIPDNGVDDYDFAIFGPDVTCTTLGSAIRCSSTNPQNAGVQVATGLNMEETDTQEGPGEDGNGYLQFIDAQVGDVYYLLVDRAVGSGPFSLFYTGMAELPPNVDANSVNDLVRCDTDGIDDGFTEFNLESQTNDIIGGQAGTFNVTYHISLNDAVIGINPLTSPYTNISDPQTIYARIQRENGCSDSVDFKIMTGNPALLQPDPVRICSYNGSESYLLDTIIPEVIDDPTGYVFSYHTSNADAVDSINPIGSTATITEISRTIFVRVTDASNVLCFSVTSFEAAINRIQRATQPLPIVVCDDNFDGVVSVDLFEKNPEILGGLPASDFTIVYYASENDRLNATNAIGGNFQNTENPQTIYVSMIENTTGCFDYTQFEIRVNPRPVPQFGAESYIYCINLATPIPISVQSGFQYYVWSTGVEGSSLNTIFVSAPGTYSVMVTNEFNCTSEVSVVVFPSNIATITGIDIVDFSGLGNSATINVTGEGDYEFALENEFQYQDSNVFNGLLNGYYTVFVRDKNGCGVVSQEFLILDYPKYFTPNEDGYHDTWKIIGIDQFPGTKIYIFDRFGKLLHEVATTSNGWDGTNGSGISMPSSDYWFSIQIPDRPEYRGHFTLKR